MPTPEEIVRQDAERRRSEAARPDVVIPTVPPGLQSAEDIVRQEQQQRRSAPRRPQPRDVAGESFFEGAAEREEGLRRQLPEALGAATGAAIGGTVAGLPGAIIGGGGGARLGRAAGQFLFGEETDLTGAGEAGVLGPVVGRVAQFGGRLLTRVPKQKTAVARQRRESQRRAAGAKAAEIDQQLARLAERADELKNMRAGQTFQPTRNGKPVGSPVTATEKLIAEARGYQQQIEAALRNPEIAIERARAKVQAGKFPSGTTGTALGVIIGHAGFGDVFSGGAIGYIVGRMGGRLAETMAGNKAFVQWATGLRGQAASDALFTFVTNVALQPDQTPEQQAASQAFFSELLDYTSGVIAGASFAEPADQAEADQLAQEALREGRQQLDRLLGGPQGPLDFQSPIKVPRAKISEGSIRPAREDSPSSSRLPARGIQIVPGSIRPAQPGFGGGVSLP